MKGRGKRKRAEEENEGNKGTRKQIKKDRKGNKNYEGNN